MRNKYKFLLLLFFVLLFFVSCEKKIGTIEKLDVLTLPALTVKDFETVYTDSGKIQMILSAPLMESYDKADPAFSEFRSGINVFFYDGHKESVASVT